MTRSAAAIMPVRSRPSTAPTSIRASSSAESILSFRNCAVSARRVVSTVCPAKDSVMPRPRTKLSTRRPRESGDPYAAASRYGWRVSIPCETTTDCGYGSLLSQGRHRDCRGVSGTAGTTRCRRSRRRTLGGELGGLSLGGQRTAQLAARFPRHHLRQFIERQIDAMVGNAALREIIGADAL